MDNNMVVNDVVWVKKYNDGVDGDASITARRVAMAVKELAEVKVIEERLGERKTKAQETIAEFHYNTGARDFNIVGLGSVTVYLGKSTRFNKDKAALRLVEQGVSSELINQVWGEVSEEKYNSKPTIRFTAEK
jgi:hypothetical protein